MDKTSGIHGDQRQLIYDAESIQAKAQESIAASKNTFGDAFTVLTGTTLRSTARQINDKSAYSNTLPEGEGEAATTKKAQHLGHHFLNPKAPGALNLGHHR